MSTPSWSDLVQIIAPTKVAAGGVARGTLSLATAFSGLLFLSAGRLSASGPSSGIIIRGRRYTYDSTNNRPVPQPGSILLAQDNTTAGNLTTLNGAPGTNISTKSITNAVNNGSGAIRLTVTGHGYTNVDGAAYVVASVGGVTNANGQWNINVINANTIDLIGSTFASSYTSGGTIAPANQVTLTSATGFAGNLTCCITDSTSAPTRCEFQQTSKIASTTLTFDRPLANAAIVSGDSISNSALVLPALAIDGGAGNTNFEVIFDNGLEATIAYVVQAYAQTLNSIG